MRGSLPARRGVVHVEGLERRQMMSAGGLPAGVAVKAQAFTVVEGQDVVRRYLVIEAPNVAADVASYWAALSTGEAATNLLPFTPVAGDADRIALDMSLAYARPGPHDVSVSLYYGGEFVETIHDAVRVKKLPLAGEFVATAGEDFVRSLGAVTKAELLRGSLRIDWGDGLNTSVPGPGGRPVTGPTEVTGAHAYYSAGTYRVSLVDGSRGVLRVERAVVRPTPATLTERAMRALRLPPLKNVRGVFGWFTTAELVGVPDALFAGATARIDWGDGSSPDVVQPGGSSPGGNLTAAGSHTYAKAGAYRVSTTFFTAGGAVIRRVTSPMTITLRSPGGRVLKATAGVPFDGTVATANAGGGFSGEQLTIDWGDGSAPTMAVLTPAARGLVDVAGTHTYAAVGQYVVSIRRYEPPYGGGVAVPTRTPDLQLYSTIKVVA